MNKLYVPWVLWMSAIDRLTLSKASFILTLSQKILMYITVWFFRKQTRKHRWGCLLGSAWVFIRSIAVEGRGRSRIRQREKSRHHTGPKLCLTPQRITWPLRATPPDQMAVFYFSASVIGCSTLGKTWLSVRTWDNRSFSARDQISLSPGPPSMRSWCYRIGALWYIKVLL